MNIFGKLTKNPNLENRIGRGRVLLVNLLEQMFHVSNGTSTLQGEHLCKIFLKSIHQCRSYGSVKLNLRPFFFHLTLKCYLDLQPTQTNFQMALILLKENTCAKLFRNPCINVGVMDQTS